MGNYRRSSAGLRKNSSVFVFVIPCGRIYRASDEPEDIVIARLMAEKLHDSISKLSEDDRQLIYMLFFDGYSEREAAQKLGTSSMTVHNKKSRILAKLLNFLKA